uniref:Pol protein n=1 Tax=Anisakis simplex TaxID=6269 RepID=A0A0M3J980_ANISI
LGWWFKGISGFGESTSPEGQSRGGWCKWEKNRSLG